MTSTHTIALDESYMGTRFEQLVRDELAALLGRSLTGEEGQLYRKVLLLVELPLFTQVLELTGGNQLRAARLLGINRNTLRKRLRLLGLLPSIRSNASVRTARASGKRSPQSLSGIEERGFVNDHVNPG